MYEPVLMSKKSFESLTKEQQDVIMAASEKAEKFFDSEARKLDAKMEKAFKDNGVEVVTMKPEEYDAWIAVAKESSYKQFAEEVPGGQKLIDEALAVK
jgi:TRAP-type C4-dicarboxylate transport system substrate-binding protein